MDYHYSYSTDPLAAEIFPGHVHAGLFDIYKMIHSEVQKARDVWDGWNAWLLTCGGGGRGRGREWCCGRGKGEGGGCWVVTPPPPHNTNNESPASAPSQHRQQPPHHSIALIE